jgi:hypothetical protein
MKLKNFTMIRPSFWMIIPIALLFGSNLSAQTIACNDNVQVSVDPTPDGTCTVDLTADMVLEGNPINGADYLIEVMQGVNVLYTGVNVVTFGGSPHLDQTLVTRVTLLSNNNKCWGSIHVEDKADPVVLCETTTISCTQDYNAVPFPDADDNCDLNPDVQQVDLIIDASTQCDPDGGFVTVQRGFIAIDDSGNESAVCYDLIIIERPDDVDFPNDITWECDQYDTYPNITAANALHPVIKALESGTNVIDASDVTNPAALAGTGSGIVANVEGTYCNYNVSHSDQTIATCGNTFKIIRTWTVLDWCTNTVVTSNGQGEDNIQIIKVVDSTDPVITMAPFDVSANIPGQHPQPCTSQDFLPPANVTDNCNDFEVRIFTPVGEANYINGVDGSNGGLIPSPGLPLGFHIITYQAEDECGNIATLDVTVEVVDDIAPTAICDEITEVTVSSNGEAVVPASVFDDGSFDNCCLDGFLARRMDGDCNGNFDDFGPTVTFCCSDVPNSPIMVVFRVVDCYDNVNDCMVEVYVDDKIPPVVLNCPANETVTCDFYVDELAAAIDAEDYTVLEQFGVATFFDNCATNIEYTVSENINNCQEGTIVRTWVASDDNPQNATATCTQTIFVEHVSDWVVEFPADVTAECTDGQLPEFGEPEVYFDECELIGLSFEDQYFYIVADACYKIVRTHVAINWCIYEDFGYDAFSEEDHFEAAYFADWDGDGDSDTRTFRDGWNDSGAPGTADGYIVYKQTIKVNDNEDPEFVIPAIDGCIVDTDCDTDITIPYPDIQDECSVDFEVNISGDFGEFDDIQGDITISDVVPGDYTIYYEVVDNCGNTSFDNVTVTVEDCKLPTPYCLNGLVVEIMQTGMIEVWASDLNLGSFDNCPGDLIFSFSPDVNDSGVLYTCDDLGQQPVEIWVTDAAGNQDFCETFIVVQDNMGVCGSAPISVAGLLVDELDNGLEDATVELSSGNMVQTTTDATGLFEFNSLIEGEDYSITPGHNLDHDNGVSTYDVVLIVKHILGVELLDSPYKIIAADANNSGSVSTLDVVDIRKVILQIEPEFPSNTSWRFVDASYAFPDEQNPFNPGFPEVINYNDIVVSQLNTDFIAVKTGDVNNTASANNGVGGVDDRSNGAFVVTADDRQLTAGETFTVDFSAADLNVLGYQFTLEFDQEALELVDLVEGVALNENFGLTKLNEGVITTSWNGAAAKDAVLFSLEFKAAKSADLSELLKVSSRYTAAEAYNQNGGLMDVNLQFSNGVVATAGFDLYQNVPNPFQGETVIGFNLPTAGTATLTVYDLSGKVLKAVRGDFAKGYNAISISSADLPASGVLYYTLATDEDTATRKMIIVE